MFSLGSMNSVKMSHCSTALATVQLPKQFTFTQTHTHIQVLCQLQQTEVVTWIINWLNCALCSPAQAYHSSPSRSFAGTSMTRGLSMIRAVRLPFSTMPMIHDWYPSCFSMSLQNAAACSLGRAIKRPPTNQTKKCSVQIVAKVYRVSASIHPNWAQNYMWKFISSKCRKVLFITKFSNRIPIH